MKAGSVYKPEIIPNKCSKKKKVLLLEVNRKLSQVLSAAYTMLMQDVKFYHSISQSRLYHISYNLRTHNSLINLYMLHSQVEPATYIKPHQTSLVPVLFDPTMDIHFFVAGRAQSNSLATHNIHPKGPSKDFYISLR